MEFWCWNLVSFMPDIGFQLLKNLWLSLTYFFFNDSQNIILMVCVHLFTHLTYICYIE